MRQQNKTQYNQINQRRQPCLHQKADSDNNKVTFKVLNNLHEASNCRETKGNII